MQRKLFGATVFAVVLPFCLQAQQWSPAQEEVWQSVESYWGLFASEDIGGFLSYLHDDFTGWSYGAAVPRTKADMEKSLTQDFATSETISYDIKPAAIKLHGDVAIVHYYFDRTYLDDKGDRHTATGRWTDILIRQAGRWIMIGDHGGTGTGG